MPQRKPHAARNNRDIDSIREMIDFVRHQQAPMARERTDLRLLRKAPLPGIPSHGYNDPSPRLRALEPPLWENVSSSVDTEDTDPAYESENELESELMPRRRTPSPPVRGGSILSSKSTHTLGLSRSMDTSMLSGNTAPVKSTRRGSLHGDLPPNRRSVRALPPVQSVSADRPSGPVPVLDLSEVVQKTPDDIDLERRYDRPTAPSPEPTPSPVRDDDSIDDNDYPIDYIDTRWINYTNALLTNNCMCDLP